MSSILKGNTTTYNIPLLTLLPFLLFFPQVYSYVFNTSFISYFSIPKEYVSFQLHYNILSNLFIYFGFFFIIFIALIINTYFYNISKQKMSCVIISFFVICILSFIILLLSCIIGYDINIIDILNVSTIPAIIFLLFTSLLISFSITVYPIFTYILFNNNTSKKSLNNNNYHHFNNLFLNIISIFKNYYKKIRSKHNKNNNLFLIPIIILFILVFLIFAGYVFGKTKAKEKRVFWITKNKDNAKLVEIYREQNYIILCPCYISTNSVIIDNRHIIKKSDMDCMLKRFTFKTFNLVVDQTGEINQDMIINYSID